MNNKINSCEQFGLKDRKIKYMAIRNQASVEDIGIMVDRRAIEKLANFRSLSNDKWDLPI